MNEQACQDVPVEVAFFKGFSDRALYFIARGKTLNLITIYPVADTPQRAVANVRELARVWRVACGIEDWACMLDRSMGGRLHVHWFVVGKALTYPVVDKLPRPVKIGKLDLRRMNRPLAIQAMHQHAHKKVCFSEVYLHGTL